MAAQTNSLPDVVLAVVVAFTILLLGIAVGSSIIGNQTVEDGEEFRQTAVTLDGAGEWYQINDERGTNETVYTSRGYAVNLTGAPDSYVQTQQAVDIAADDTWTVAVWARVDGDATAENMTVASANGRVVITYNQTAGNWSAWHYDERSTNSHVVNVSAPNQPSTWAHLLVRSDGTNLTIYRNNTAGETANISSSSIVDAPVNASSFDGRLEELRTFDDALNASERGDLVGSPIAPQLDGNRTARAMFDEPYRNSQLLLFTNTRMGQSNVTFSQGFAGSTLTNDDEQPLQSGDYAWNEAGPNIKPLAGGDAADLPVVYVDYTLEYVDPLGRFVTQYGSAMVLAGLIPVVLLVGFIVVRLQSAGR